MQTTLLDLLLKEGYFLYPEDAETYLQAGQVLVNGERITEGKHILRSRVKIQILDGTSSFSIEGVKLLQALQRMGLYPAQKHCLDFGATRGGVSEALQGAGAASLFTLYYDAKQLSPIVSQRPGFAGLAIRQAGGHFDLLSSIAQTQQVYPYANFAVLHGKKEGFRKLLPYFRAIVPHGEIIWHLQPLLEINLPLAQRLKVINPKAYLPFLQDLINEIHRHPGLVVRNVVPSAHTYYSGKPEFYLYILAGSPLLPQPIDQVYLKDIINEALQNAKQAPSFLADFSRFTQSPVEEEPEESPDPDFIPLPRKRKKSLKDRLLALPRALGLAGKKNKKNPAKEASDKAVVENILEEDAGLWDGYSRE